MLNTQAGKQNRNAVSGGDANQPGLLVEPGEERTTADCDQHDRCAQRHVYPEESANLLMVEFGPFDGCGGKAQILKHAHEVDENRNHRDQTVVIGR